MTERYFTGYEDVARTVALSNELAITDQMYGCNVRHRAITAPETALSVIAVSRFTRAVCSNGEIMGFVELSPDGDE